MEFFSLFTHYGFFVTPFVNFFLDFPEISGEKQKGLH